jgi:hypothetical protein
MLGHNNFIGNRVFSSYTFQAQGGAVMISFGSVSNVSHCKFENNTATPIMNTMPYTFSGTGGAMFVESATIDIIDTSFIYNIAMTGQFDDGATGGAILMENVNYGTIDQCRFELNSAQGFFEYSSYASSGAGGAISLKFSSITLKNSYVVANWVSVGGMQMSVGGGLAIFFNYVQQSADTSTKEPVRIENCTFGENFAYAQLCRTASTKSGEGGGIALVGAASPGVLISDSSFYLNAAVSTRTGLVPSVGGAVAMTMSSALNISGSLFKNNLALYGIGNDISSITAQPEGNVTNTLYVQSTEFQAAYDQLVAAYKQFAKKNMTTLCAISRGLKDSINEYVGTSSDRFTSAPTSSITTMSSKAAALAKMAKLSKLAREARRSRAHSHHFSRGLLEVEDSEVALRYRSILQTAVETDISDEVLVAIETVKALIDSHVSDHNKNSERSHRYLLEDNQQISVLSSFLVDLQKKHEYLTRSPMFEEEWMIGSHHLDRETGGAHAATPSSFRRKLSPVQRVLTARYSGEASNAADAPPRRQLRAQKSKFAKTQFSQIPSIVVCGGFAEIVSPIFLGDYHVFVGDFVYLKNLYTSDGGYSSSQMVLSALTNVFTASELILGGLVKQEELSITVLKAGATLSRNDVHAITVNEIRMWNSTLLTSNDLVVTGNSSFVDSTIVGENHMANIYFNSTVHTGLGFERTKTPLLENVDDNDLPDHLEELTAVLAATPILVIKNAILRIQKHFRLTSDWINAVTLSKHIFIELLRDGMIVIEQTGALVINTKTTITSDKREHYSLNNSGLVWLYPLDPASNTIMDVRMDALSMGDTEPADTSSSQSPLALYGRMYQETTGTFRVTVSNDNYNQSLLLLEDGGTLKGSILVELSSNTTVILSDNGVPTNWSFVGTGLGALYPLAMDATPVVKPAGLGMSTVPKTGPYGTTQYYLVVDGLQCSDVVTYYSGASSDNLCFYCSLNSSCSYCGSGTCSNSGECGGSSEWHDCCGEGGCSSNGHCKAQDTTTHTDYECVCKSILISGVECRTLSEYGFVVVFVIFFVITLIVVVFYYNRYFNAQKTEILEDLRQNLLTPTALNNKSVGSKSQVNRKVGLVCANMIL